MKEASKMHVYELTIKEEYSTGKFHKYSAFQVGTDYGNACKRFLCEHDMKDKEICGIEYLGRAMRLDIC